MDGGLELFWRQRPQGESVDFSGHQLTKRAVHHAVAGELGLARKPLGYNGELVMTSPEASSFVASMLRRFVCQRDCFGIEDLKFFLN